MALRSCHHAKVKKREGARWRAIREDHLRKMNDQLSCGEPLDIDCSTRWRETRVDNLRKMNDQLPRSGEPFHIDHNDDAVAEPGWQGCLSRPRRSKPALSLFDRDGSRSERDLVQSPAIRANGVLLQEHWDEFVAEVRASRSWQVSVIWAAECVLNTRVILEGTANSAQMVSWEVSLRENYPDARPMAQRFREEDPPAKVYVLNQRYVAGRVLGTSWINQWTRVPG